MATILDLEVRHQQFLAWWEKQYLWNSSRVLKELCEEAWNAALNPDEETALHAAERHLNEARRD